MAWVMPPDVPSFVGSWDDMYDLFFSYRNLAEYADAYGPLSTTTLNQLYAMQAARDGFNNYVQNLYFNNNTALAVSNWVRVAPTVNPPIIPNTTAGSAYAQAILNGVEVAQSGGITSTAKEVVTYAGPSVKDELNYAAAALVPIAMDAALCGIAAIMGYDIGRSIVDLNPDLFIESYQRAYPWMFKAIDKVAGIQYGDKTYLDSRLVNAIREFIENNIEPGELDKYVVSEDEEVKVFIPDDTSAPSEFSFVFSGIKIVNGVSHSIDGYERISLPAGYVGIPRWTGRGSSSTNPAWSLFYINLNSASVAPDSSLVSHQVVTAYGNVIYTASGGGGSYTKNGRTVRWNRTYSYHSISNTGFEGAEGLEVIPGEYHEDGFGSLGDALWELAYGNVYDVSYPEGVSEWQGNIVPDISSGAIDVIFNPLNEETVPFYPVSFPPYNADKLDPVNNPNPQQPTDPSTQIQPYADTSNLRDIIELILSKNPISNPNDDPSQNPEPGPSSQQDPMTPPGKKDDGETPTPTPPSILPPFDVGSDGGGLVNVYHPSSSQLYAFANWLWVTWRDSSIDKMINNPFDGVISLHEIYATPNDGAVSSIKSGFLVSSASAPTVPNRYSEINCGSVGVEEVYNNYLDYSPYTKAFIYLPFIGIVEVSADDIIGNYINITYGIDSYSGACVAKITCARDGYSALLYQFSGNCSVDHPISGGSQAALKAGMMSAGAYGLTSVIAGLAGAAPLAASAAGATLSDVINLVSQKSSVQHSGTFSGNFGAMGLKNPFIIVKRPRQVIVPGYNLDYGYPAHKSVSVGSCKGYLRVREVNVISATATNEEKAKIEELLKEGVYVT